MLIQTDKNSGQGSQLRNDCGGSYMATIERPSPGSGFMEEWKFIKGFEDYDISNQGRIKSWKNIPSKILKSHIRDERYNTITLYNTEGQSLKYVHRLVAIAFIRNPENKPEVNHKDGNKSNNKSNNLEWCTESENELHAYKIGLKNAKGENNGRSKLNSFQVRVIRKTKDLNHTELGEIFNISRSVITLIINNKIWTK